jgi:hypothetical protein
MFAGLNVMLYVLVNQKTNLSASKVTVILVFCVLFLLKAKWGLMPPLGGNRPQFAFAHLQKLLLTFRKNVNEVQRMSGCLIILHGSCPADLIYSAENNDFLKVWCLMPPLALVCFSANIPLYLPTIINKVFDIYLQRSVWLSSSPHHMCILTFTGLENSSQ